MGLEMADINHGVGDTGCVLAGGAGPKRNGTVPGQRHRCELGVLVGERSWCLGVFALRATLTALGKSV